MCGKGVVCLVGVIDVGERLQQGLVVLQQGSNDCHVPHTSIFAKYYFKATNGLRHSYVFTMRNEPQRMQAIPESQVVIYENCVRCHSQLNQEFVKTDIR